MTGTLIAQQLREGKYWQMGLHENKKLLYSKGNSHQTKEKVYRMGEKSLPAIHLTRD
jgi:hypothetical protein